MDIQILVVHAQYWLILVIQRYSFFEKADKEKFTLCEDLHIYFNLCDLTIYENLVGVGFYFSFQNVGFRSCS